VVQRDQQLKGGRGGGLLTGKPGPVEGGNPCMQVICKEVISEMLMMVTERHIETGCGMELRKADVKDHHVRQPCVSPSGAEGQTTLIRR